ncbi:lysozyme inhibitor LprI family protein [Pseudomarimonas salicorniae]|uniref:DUF1311 domain-containing protein n=1 Tax=Pseudomarimonas salicorniae TaxID=2933270 RepID=A0ABT0GNQ5_9GAMM|nr:lysozyme inhibitor LprI family protein [Lysobacter sp. CAU 1642]MCK7595620.1 DUF1311 domain-containing protein [Lysobacter sp. CAU 1642]
MKPIALVLMLLLPVCCLAEEVCDSAVTTVELNACAAKELEKAEEALNATYRRVLGQLAEAGESDPDAKLAREQLVAAQRLWIKYREADCRAVFTLHQSGTMRTLMELGCMSGHATQRTRELESFIQ